MSTVHKFDPANHSDSADWWELVYRRAFPAYVTHSVVSDVKLQKAGIDHRIQLAGGGELLVDCKTREKFYSDILVEVWSDKGRRVKGWARKPLRCHYVAYAFPSAEVAYLIPFHLLQRAYELNKQRWSELCDQKDSGVKRVEAKNADYLTVSVVVPLDELRRCVAESMLVYFDDKNEPFDP